VTALPIVYAIAAALVVWFAIEGARDGVVRRLVEIVGLVLVFVFASRLAGDLEPVLHDNWGLPARGAFIGSWITVLVGGVILVRLLAKLSQKIVRLTITGWLDRAGGAFLGALFGAILASCALILVVTLPIEEDLRRDIRDDAIVGPVLHLAPAVYDVARGAWDGPGFFEMIEEHVSPKVRERADQIRAAVEDAVGTVEGEIENRDGSRD